MFSFAETVKISQYKSFVNCIAYSKKGQQKKYHSFSYLNCYASSEFLLLVILWIQPDWTSTIQLLFKTYSGGLWKYFILSLQICFLIDPFPYISLLQAFSEYANFHF